MAAQSVLAVFPPNSPLPRTLHKFQSLVSRPPNCYIQFKLCACGSVHGYLTSLIDLDAATPLFVGDPPVDHLDFVIQFDGGAFREHRVGGSGMVLWKHTTQGLTLLDTFAVPLFPCPDAAYAETVGAAHAVLMAARHFPHHRPSRILIKGDNRPIIDFMNSVGKLRRTDLQKLLTLKRSTHLPFPFPPFYGVTLRGNSTNVRIFLQVLLVITRNSPSLLNCCPIPFLPSLSHSPLPFLPSTLLTPLHLLFLLHPRPLPFRNLLTFRFPPSLSSLAKLFTPLRYSATFEPSKKAPLHLPRYLSFIAPQQMISEDAFTPSRLGPPNFLGITVPCCLVVPILKLILLALIISFFQRFALSLLDISFPSVDQLRALLSADFSSHPHFLEQYPTSPKDLPTILLNSSLESTLLYYRGKGYWPSHQVRALLHQISQTKPRLLSALNQSLGPRTLSSLTSANLFFHTMEHPETLWLKSFTSYILSHHSTSSLIWLHDGIWLAPPPPSSLIVAANQHATSALNLGDRPLLIKTRPCTSLYQHAWQLFQLPGLLPQTLLPLHPYRLPRSTPRYLKSKPAEDSNG